MSKSIIIDPGHGGTDPGATGFGIQEKAWNLKISLYQYNRLKELGAKVAITRTSDISLDSNARTALIRNKYDLCISNHWNAFNGQARGVETIYSIKANTAFARDLANALVSTTGIPLRRVFTRTNSSGTDYYFMHRLTGNTNTVIIEYGFLDNRLDHNYFLNEANFYKAAEAVIEAVCKQIGITYKAPGANVSKPSTPSGSVSGKLFRVQTGAFKNRVNADSLQESIEQAGFDTYLVQDQGLYKVQVGAYSKRENAEAQAKKLEVKGFQTFITTAVGNPAHAAKNEPTQPTILQLTIDGSLGSATARRWQEVMGTQATGIIGGQIRHTITNNIAAVQFGTGGSMLIREVQRVLGVTIDGSFGPNTLRALQRRMGTPVTGAISRTDSAVVKELQRRLNRNMF